MSAPPSIPMRVLECCQNVVAEGVPAEDQDLFVYLSAAMAKAVGEEFAYILPEDEKAYISQGIAHDVHQLNERGAKDLSDKLSGSINTEESDASARLDVIEDLLYRIDKRLQALELSRADEASQADGVF